MTVVNAEVKEKQQNTDKKNENQQTKIPSEEDYSNWGYDLYPDRNKHNKKLNITNYLLNKGRESMDTIRCERKVYQCIKTSPIVKLMIGALKSSGCSVDIRRHIACEECAVGVTGGYDPILNQVIICQNNVKSMGITQGVLTHEFIHMFDYCRNNLDFKNIDHLACTEIRAANLAHCSFMSAMTTGDASPFNIKQAHQNCVKTKALSSVMAARNVSKAQAMEAIERVFPKCYPDLEPIGRRLRRNSLDMERAYAEGHYYGFNTP